MRRRDFIGALAGGALLPVLRVSAQESGRVYRLAILANSDRESAPIVAFFDELRLHGFSEEQNLDIVVEGFRYREDQTDRWLDAIMKAAPDAVVSPEPATRALQKLATAIPIVCMTEDMLEAGLVASLARPGGNTTGISLLSRGLDAKRLDILMEAFPHAQKIAAIADANITPSSHVDNLKNAQKCAESNCPRLLSESPRKRYPQ